MIEHIYIDMDNTIADFNRSPMLKEEIQPGVWVTPSEMYSPGFFETLSPLDGALAGVREVIKFAKKNNIKVHILSKPVAISAYSYSEKVAWIMKWFPELFGNIILCQDKGRIIGKNSVLIDDSLDWKKPWEDNGGVFIHFNETESSLPYWKGIVSQIEELHNAK